MNGRPIPSSSIPSSSIPSSSNPSSVIPWAPPSMLILAAVLSSFATAVVPQDPTPSRPSPATELPRQRRQPEVYKQVGDVELRIELVAPDGHTSKDRRPAIMFFFGGGWNGGTTEQFRPQADYLASRGMVAALADYRVRSRHGTTPFACVADGACSLELQPTACFEFEWAPTLWSATRGPTFEFETREGVSFISD